MITLMLAVTLPVQVACTNCSSSGWVYLDCPKCAGKGVVANPRHNYTSLNAIRSSPDIPCSKCTRGLVKKGAKGTGKIRRTCPVCKGQKKIKSK